MKIFITVFMAFCLFVFTGCASTPKQSESIPEPPGPINEVFHNLIPQNFVLSYKTLSGNMELKEYVPKGETSDNWTEMITIQTYLGMVQTSPKKYASLIKGMGKRVCPGIKSTVGESTIQNGYKVYNWKQVCQLNPNTNRVEATLIKAIAGYENFYTIQKAWAYYPNEKETLTWQHFLNSTLVCDTGVPGRACPKPVTGDQSIE